MTRRTEKKLRVCSVVITIAISTITLIQGFGANPADLGLTPIHMRWLSIFVGMLGIAAGFLPPAIRYGKSASDVR